GPDGRVIVASLRRIGRVRCTPAIRSGIVSPTVVKVAAGVAITAPDNHLSAGPDGGVIVAWLRRAHRAGWRPAIRSGVVSSACVTEPAGVAIAAPANHL